MGTKQQQTRIGSGGQAKRPGRPVSRHVPCGADAIETAGSGESPKLTTSNETELLTQQLMERVVDPVNMNKAYQRVLSNKGAAGVDGMPVNDLREWIHENKERLLTSLLTGKYKPEAVRGVQIPKASGGVRQLGIPTVVDRMVQQAMAQVLEPILEPLFSESSFGFRPGRGAHDALRQAG